MNKRLLSFLRTTFFIFLSSAGIITACFHYFVTLNGFEKSQLRFLIQRPFHTSVIRPFVQNCADISANAVNIAFIFNKADINALKTALVSAKQNKCPQSVYRIHIIEKNPSTDMDDFLQTLKSDDFSIKKITKTNSFFIVDVLPDLEKVLYVKNHSLILKDLTPLFSYDLTNYSLGAVRYEERTGLVDTGVMLLNLKKIRQDDLKTHVQNIRRENPRFRVAEDTDILKILTQQSTLFLPYFYNIKTSAFTTNNFADARKKDFFKYLYTQNDVSFPETVEQSYENAVIVQDDTWAMAPSRFFKSWDVMKPLKKIWSSYTVQ